MASNTLNVRIPPDLEARMNKVCGRQPDGTFRSKASVLIAGGYMRMDEIEAGIGGKPQTVPRRISAMRALLRER